MAQEKERDENDGKAEAEAEAAARDDVAETTLRQDGARAAASESDESDSEDSLGDFIYRLVDLRIESEPSEPVLSSFDLDGVAEYIRENDCKNVIVLAGAGISVSAGIPDFRTPGTGLYSKLARYGLPHPEAIFELDFFRNNPEPFYTLARELFPGEYEPTTTHHFIKLLHEKGILLRCFTQNIDSLETEAGVPRDKVVAAHGNFDSATCIDTGKKVPVSELKEAIFDDSEASWKKLEEKHGGLVKPDIVFFGEQLPRHFFKLAAEDFPKCDLLIVLGTSLVVQPFASLIGRVHSTVPRLLINREKVAMFTRAKHVMGISTEGFRFHQRSNYRDALFLGDVDAGVEQLSRKMGWEEDLRRLIDSRG